MLAGVRAVLADLAGAPFMAPEAGRLRELGLDGRAIGAAARAGLLLRVTEQIVLAPGAEAEAARALAGLPQPFTAAEARQALGTTRRVAIPLLEYLDRAGITQRLPDDRRRVRLNDAAEKSGLACIGRLCPASEGSRDLGRLRESYLILQLRGTELPSAGHPVGGNSLSGVYRLRNSGERRRASATRRAVPKVLTARSSRNPPPWTRNTDAPGVSAIEMFAYINWFLRTVTRRAPSLST